MSDPTPARLVFVGSCKLTGGKPGELWATEEAALAAADLNALRRASSPFSKFRRSFNVGGVYEVEAEVVEGRPTTIVRASAKWKATIDNDVTAAAVLYERSQQAADAAKRAEEKARKAGPADDLLDQVARIVATAPFEMQSKVISGFAADVQRRALDIWKKGPRR
jgi:hypothetical protein